jgi:hypothetical protein
VADERTFIEKAQSRARAYTGRDLSPAEMAENFATNGIVDRVTALEELAAEQDAITSPREAAKHLAMTRALRDTHERLRKIGR